MQMVRKTLPALLLRGSNILYLILATPALILLVSSQCHGTDWTTTQSERNGRGEMEYLCWADLIDLVDLGHL